MKTKISRNIMNQIRESIFFIDFHECVICSNVRLDMDRRYYCNIHGKTKSPLYECKEFEMKHTRSSKLLPPLLDNSILQFGIVV